MLSDFFRINLPYGLAKNDKGEWMAFNREYMPLGFNTNIKHELNLHADTGYPVHTKYKGLREATIEKLAITPKSIERDNDGKIKKVWLYNDATNPSNDSKHWDAYLEKLKYISKFKR